MKKLLATILLLCIYTIGFCQTGSTGFEFLRLLGDAKTIGMAGAITAMDCGISSLLSNPAGIKGANNTEILFAHNQWVFDIKQEYFGAKRNFGKIGNFALAVSYFGSGAIEGRDDDGNLTAPYDNSDITGVLGYSRDIFSNISTGLSLKYIKERIEYNSSNAFAADVGLLYKTPLKGLSTGLSILNLGPDAKMIAEKTPLPKTARFGIAYGFTKGIVTTVSALDLVKPFESDLQENIGLELSLYERFYLRSGYRLGEDNGKFTAGLGVAQKVAKYSFNVDYAFRDMGVLGKGQWVSLGFGF